MLSVVSVRFCEYLFTTCGTFNCVRERGVKYFYLLKLLMGLYE